MIKQRIGDLLVSRGLVEAKDIAQAVSAQAEIGGYIGETLIKIGAISEDDLVDVLAEQMQVEKLTASDLPEDTDDVLTALDQLRLSSRWLKAVDAAIWFADNKHEHAQLRVSVASLHPLSLELREGVEAALLQLDQPCKLDFRICTRVQLEQLHALIGNELSLDDGTDDVSMQRLKEMAQEAPVIDFVNRLFEASLKRNASDIHIEPYEHAFEVRLRVDGILQTQSTHPRAKFNAISSRIKLLSGMDIAEQRLPQDGRQSVRLGGEMLDLRVSSLPGTWGESLVLRLLRKEKTLPSLVGLGLEGQPARVMETARNYQNGVILVTGPTGSGKSTTLYRTLEELNDGLKKIITVEDPVEYDMPAITQVQIRADIGYTFARGLRAILRHDPDIVMVGEIRDGETASIAARAALTGHLVLSTLHTNSALGAIERLLDLGLEPFLIASSVRALAAQRLVRRLCPSCSVPEDGELGERMLQQVRNDGADLGTIGTEPANWKKAVGCEDCNHLGYVGRLGLYEAALIDPDLQQVIATSGKMSEISAAARRQGFLTLQEDGLLKARRGLTSLDEVIRVVGNREVEMAD
ncbi:ATPase, T2SS/T4P/T4SS family [Hyphomonas sp. FCG-A18]|uniref:GspE/PulE family protein n=1 Tax=Hyphomonas sp. FCG-A18 TaxID=3080019 RepID=UPI002B2ECBB7|nr:ATPase, T2SS/T4P/T4SS family [Hyphomonas sp. FCG-A18]